MGIFVGFEDFIYPGYKFYRPLYRDFVITAHRLFLQFDRRTDISPNPSEDADGKDGSVGDFGTVRVRYIRMM